MPRIRDAVEQRQVGDYTLTIYADEDCDNPREMSEGLGKMICFHGRHKLGDEHGYRNPCAFLTDVVQNSFSGIELHQKVLSGELPNFEIERNNGSAEWRLYFRETGKIEYREWMVNRTFNQPIEEIEDKFTDALLYEMPAAAMRDLIAERNVIQPLYLYDHSGLSISTESFTGRAVHAEWDSGMLGEIYCSYQDVEEAYGSLSEKTIERAAECLKAEVDEYDHYLRGNCYGFVITDETDTEVDSCWGFIGRLDEVKGWMNEQVDSEYEFLFDNSFENEQGDEMEWGDDD